MPALAVLHGPDVQALDDALAAVTRALFPDTTLATLGREVYDARETSADTIARAAETLPLGVSTRLVADLRGAIGLEAFHEDAERWDGEIRQDGNLGRTELLLALWLRQRIGSTELSLGVRAPLWRHIVVGDEPTGEISSPAIVSIGFQHVFGGAHGHAR